MKTCKDCGNIMTSEYHNIHSSPFAGYFKASALTSIVMFPIIFIGIDVLELGGLIMALAIPVSTFMVRYVFLKFLKVLK